MGLTITRALSELKTLDSRITKEISELNAVDIEQRKYAGKALKTSQSTEDFISKAKESYQRINDLMKRRTELKASVIKANACTSVKVGSKTLTIAEAIDYKKFIILKKSLLRQLCIQKAQIDKTREDARVKLDADVNTMITHNLGKDRKSTPEDYDTIAKPFIQANEFVLIDPIKIADKIIALEKEITEFELEIDIALSEANSKTEIE